MFIKDFGYLKPTIDCGDHYEIPDLSREAYTTKAFMSKIKLPELTTNTAVLLAGGFNIHQSESRSEGSINPRYLGSVKPQPTSMIIKESTAYTLHQWIGSLNKPELVTYASINSNTCASSMHSIYEANQLLSLGVCDEVLIIAEEKTSSNTLRIFKEHHIDLLCGDGFAYILLSRKRPKKYLGYISNTKWVYEYNRNPFHTTVEGYAKIIPQGQFNYIKPHGTGTPTNNAAEIELLNKKGTKFLFYKDKIGHTQGVSALLELCLTLDNPSVKGEILCLASGLGGFYGSCVLRKS